MLTANTISTHKKGSCALSIHYFVLLITATKERSNQARVGRVGGFKCEQNSSVCDTQTVHISSGIWCASETRRNKQISVETKRPVGCYTCSHAITVIFSRVNFFYRQQQSKTKQNKTTIYSHTHTHNPPPPSPPKQQQQNTAKSHIKIVLSWSKDATAVLFFNVLPLSPTPPPPTTLVDFWVETYGDEDIEMFSCTVLSCECKFYSMWECMQVISLKECFPSLHYW